MILKHCQLTFDVWHSCIIRLLFCCSLLLIYMQDEHSSVHDSWSIKWNSEHVSLLFFLRSQPKALLQQIHLCMPNHSSSNKPALSMFLFFWCILGTETRWCAEIDFRVTDRRTREIRRHKAERKGKRKYKETLVQSVFQGRGLSKGKTKVQWSRQPFYCPSLHAHSNDVTLYNTSLIIITFFKLHLSMQSYKVTKQIKHLKIK